MKLIGWCVFYEKNSLCCLDSLPLLLTGCLLSGLLFPSPLWLEPHNVTNSQPLFFSPSFLLSPPPFPLSFPLFLRTCPCCLQSSQNSAEHALVLHPAAASALKMDAFFFFFGVGGCLWSSGCTVRCNESSWKQQLFHRKTARFGSKCSGIQSFFTNKVAPCYPKKKKKITRFSRMKFCIICFHLDFCPHHLGLHGWILLILACCAIKTASPHINYTSLAF